MPDTYRVEQSPFSPEQYAAARYMVARIASEARGESLEPEAIGMKFTPLGDFPVATVDDGTVITASDFMRASLLMLWSLVVDMSDMCEVSPAEVISAVGVSLAEHHPA